MLRIITEAGISRGGLAPAGLRIAYGRGGRERHGQAETGHNATVFPRADCGVCALKVMWIEPEAISGKLKLL